MLGLGLVRQLCRPDTCANMGLAGPADTIVRETVRRRQSHNDYHLQVVGEGNRAPHCNGEPRRISDLAFHLAQPRVEGGLPGSHQLHEGSKVRYTWLDGNNEWHSEERSTPHLAV